MEPAPDGRIQGREFAGSPSSSARFMRQISVGSSVCESENEEPDGFTPGPLVSLKEQLDLDKEDESLRRWKEQLLGSIHYDDIEEQVEPEVHVSSLSILSEGRPEISIPAPFSSDNAGQILFSLKEGSRYRLKFIFSVLHNIVSGLTYLNTVWKGDLQVDQSHVMLGTFSPQKEPYTHIMAEDTAPSGLFVRGIYTANTKFVDDDNRCYLELNYSFEIRKGW